MDKYVILESEIAIGAESTLTKLYPSKPIYDLPADYYDHRYIVQDGVLVIDVDGEKAQKIEALTADYTAEKANLCEAYTTATMTGDTETAESVAVDMADLDAWFDEEYKAIEEGSAE